MFRTRRRTRTGAPWKRLRRESRAQSLAEFAIVVPMLLMLLIGMVEFARGWMVRQVITNVAREGARLAILPNSNQSQVQARIDSLLTVGGINPASASVTLNLCSGPNCTGTADEVQIAVPYQFTLLGPVISFVCQGSCGSLGSVTLRTTSRMRNE